MNEAASLVFSLIVGFLLGVFFFGSLWWTVRRGVLSKQPALWFFGSMLIRSCMVLSGFYFILWNENMLAGLLGFFISRLIATRLAASGSWAGDHAS